MSAESVEISERFLTRRSETRSVGKTEVSVGHSSPIFLIDKDYKGDPATASLARSAVRNYQNLDISTLLKSNELLRPRGAGIKGTGTICLTDVRLVGERPRDG